MADGGGQTSGGRLEWQTWLCRRFAATPLSPLLCNGWSVDAEVK